MSQKTVSLEGLKYYTDLLLSKIASNTIFEVVQTLPDELNVNTGKIYLKTNTEAGNIKYEHYKPVFESNVLTWIKLGETTF